MQQTTHRHVSRRTVLLGTCVFLAGCVGDDDSDSDESPTDGSADEGDNSGSASGDGDDSNPATGEISQQGDLQLTSSAFDDGETISDRYGYDSENVNPPLSIRSVPADAESLALGVDDPDAVEPAGKVWDHWVVWNIAADTREIPEGWSAESATEGTNDFDEVGYGGPSPPDGKHRYRFKCFALDTTLDLPQSSGLAELGEAMREQVLAATQLDGTFTP